MSRLKEMTGLKFGKLTVVGRTAGREGYTDAIWLCRCDCGNTATATGTGLRRGGTVSCGCWKIKHGQANRTPEYHTWEGIKQRCLNPNHVQYGSYGGRGITVCERWMEFENFYADMGRRPGPGYSIDRIDNNGNYEPGNCRWATAKEQQRNTRRTLPGRIATDMLRQLDYWPHRADFQRVCKTGDRGEWRVKWWRAAGFVKAGPDGPPEEIAALNVAVAIATDRFGLQDLDRAERRAVAEAFAHACGQRLEGLIPEPGHSHPGFIPGTPETCGACAREAKDEGRRRTDGRDLHDRDDAGRDSR